MTFLQRFNHDCNCMEYAAIPETTLEWLNTYETYTAFGQTVGHELAGDYLELLTEDACKAASEILLEEYGMEKAFRVGDYINAYDNSFLFNELKDREDVEVSFMQCFGFTYWDGHNFKTIVVQDDYGFEPDWTVVNDEVAVELAQAIEEKEFVGVGTGYEEYGTEKWRIKQSFWQGSWATYEIMLNEDVEALTYY